MKSNKTRIIIPGIILIAIILTIVFITYGSMNQTQEVPISDILIEMEKGNVKEVKINNDKVEVKYRNSTKKSGYDAFAYGRAYLEAKFDDYNDRIKADIRFRVETAATVYVLEEIKKAGIPEGIDREIEFKKRYAELAGEIEADYIRKISEEAGKEDGRFIQINPNNRDDGAIWNLIYPIGALLLFAIIAVIIYRSISNQNKQATSFGKTKTHQAANLKVKFTDVAGAEEEKVELAEIVEFLKSPQKFTKVGAKIPRGVLLVGPPGTGKTLFAKAVAGEANVPFFSISGSDFVEMFVGVGASRVRDLFDQAKRSMPCIVFIDEIDAVGRHRGAGLGGGHDEREQTLNQLLVQMDGFETNEGIIVMAATNRADILDPALLRPGRFDRQVHVHLPDVRGREAIFKVHARSKPIAADVDFQALARITHGFTGADIANTLNESAIICARENRTEITMNDISEGINKATLGPQKKSRVVTEFDKRVTAYHEAGHAIVAKTCKSGLKVHEVSIIPRGGGAGGFTRPRPTNDNQMDTVACFKDDIATTMGGRAAEAIVIEDISTGASGDIRMVTGLARRMVTEWGMSGNPKVGQVFYGSDQEVFLGRDYGTTHNYSEEMAAEIDKEVARIVEEGYTRALEVLTKYRKELDIMARTLLECETIYSEEVDLIMAGESVENVKTALEERLKKKYEKIQ
ncbi:MAG: ATP-dependent zinc metalloprotease FtsH [Firmicutes bacterium]|nr:ATP-dependent zinc metalloprotease FtsH [Bacillota bacterium]